MTPEDQKLEELDRQVPELARIAFSRAYEQALAAGHSVYASGILTDPIEVERCGTGRRYIFEVFPDGSRQIIKEIEPRIPVIPGTKFKIE